MALILEDERELGDLAGIGQAMLGDFRVLGVQSVGDLARRDPDRLYAELCRLTGATHDICVLDTLRCAVAQAKDPGLPKEQRNWWWWSRQRKAGRI
jgi:nucleotidyltransferase/DNA polymerase involved in DNA repair